MRFISIREGINGDAVVQKPSTAGVTDS